MEKSFINSVERLSKLLLDSLPHPALITSKDRIILAANKKAVEEGAEVGKYCWQEYRHLEIIPNEDRKYFEKHGKPPPGGTRCTFCKADSAIEKRCEENDPEIIICDSVFNTYWIHLEDDIYLHYSIDVTAERKNLKNTKEQRELLQNLAYFQKEVSRLDSAELISKAFDFIKKQTGADFAGIMLLEDDQKDFRLFHTTAKKKSEREELLKLHNTILSKVVEDGTPLYREDIRKSKQVFPTDKNILKKGMQSVFLIPLLHESKCIGTLNIASKSKDGFPGEARTFLEQIAPYLTQAIKNAQLYEALAESTKNYKTLHENVPVGLFRSKPDGEILSANRTMWKMFGYSNSDEIVSTQAASHYECPEERDLFLRELSNQEKVLDFETRMKKKNGSLFYASVTARATKDKNGVVLYIDGTIENIDKRKSAESALKESENQLKERVKELEGMYSLGRLADKTKSIDDLLNVFADDIAPQSMQYPEKTLAVIKIENNKYGNSNLDDMACSLSAPIMINGKQKGTLSIGYSENLPFIDYYEQKLVDGYARRLGRIIEGKRSETALRISEEMLSSFLDSAPSIFILTDSDFNILLVNKTGKKELGETFNPSFEKPEANLIDIYPDLNISGVDKKYRKVLKTGKPLTLNNISLQTNIEEIYVSIIAFKVGDRLGLIMRDVTLQKKKQEDLIKMEKLESLGLLAGGLAHDFNNILAALLGNISLAQMHLETESEAWNDLAEAEKAVEQATGLTKQLLTFAKGGSPLKETANIKNLLRDSAKFILRGTKAKAKFRIDTDLWNVDVDLGQLGQVVNNLIINSVHSMPDGGIIEIDAKNVPDGSKVEHELTKNKYVKISIKDHGSGIPNNIKDKIFDPYFTTKTEGTGLGLVGAHSIINNHSGYIKFESHVGVGSVFEIYLPASGKKALQRVKDFDQTLGGEGKIMVMDDDKQVLSITKNILIHIGFQVETAEDGEEAIRKYKTAFNSNNPYQAVILDLTIPGGLGGVITIEKILEFDPMVKAIAMSGYSNNSVIAEYKNYGFKGVITKPYTVQQFNRVMRQVLKK